mgnify:CR=1 FL=1
MDRNITIFFKSGLRVERGVGSPRPGAPTVAPAAQLLRVLRRLGRALLGLLHLWAGHADLRQFQICQIAVNISQFLPSFKRLNLDCIEIDFVAGYSFCKIFEDLQDVRT